MSGLVMARLVPINIRNVFTLFTLGFLASSRVMGAACCGPTPLFPTILLSGESGQVTLQYQKLQSAFYIDPTGHWIPYQSLTITSYRFDNVWRWDQNWQVSISLPFESREVPLDSSQALRSLSVALNRPLFHGQEGIFEDGHFFGSVSVAIPTTNQAGGSGDWSLVRDLPSMSWSALGFIPTASPLFSWLAAFQTSIFMPWYLPSVEGGSSRYQLGPSVQMAGGIQWEQLRWRVSLLLNHRYQTESWVRNARNDVVLPDHHVTALLLMGSWMLSKEWSMALTYTDESILRIALSNTVFSGWGFVLQRKFW